MYRRSVVLRCLVSSTLAISGCGLLIDEAPTPIASTDGSMPPPTCAPTEELCDGLDDDCDGVIDEDPAICACVAPQVDCGAGCVDTGDDPSNCGMCGNVCPSGSCVGGVCCEPVPPPLDVLFVIDDSMSMTEEQGSLASALPGFVEALGRSHDQDGDGLPDLPPLSSVHIGVVTTNMGSGGFTLPTCVLADFGDDGILQAAGRSSCPGVAPFISYRPGTDPSTAALASASCVTQQGTQGCGIEQPLEAALKALTPATSSLRFFRTTVGHGDGANAGFLRDDSVLALMVLTDEDDCSVRDPNLLDPDGPYSGELNIRCVLHEAAALHEVDRYVSGFTSLRSDPRDLVFAAVVGVPPDLVGMPYDDVLADPRMSPTVDVPTNTLDTSCGGADGLAFPPRRIVRSAQGLEATGASTVLGSVCESSYAETLSATVTAVANRYRDSCSPGP